MKVKQEGTQDIYYKEGSAEWNQDYSNISAYFFRNTNGDVNTSQSNGEQWGSAPGSFVGRGGYIAGYRDEARLYLILDVTFPTAIKPHNWIFETIRFGSSSNGHPAWYPALWYWNGSSWVNFFSATGWDYGDYWRNYTVNCPVYANRFRMRFGNSGSSYEDEIGIRNISLPSYVKAKDIGTEDDYTTKITVPAYKSLFKDSKYYSL